MVFLGFPRQGDGVRRAAVSEISDEWEIERAYLTMEAR